MKQLYICNKANKCKDTSCDHHEPHELICVICGYDIKDCDCEKPETCEELEEECDLFNNVQCIPYYKEIEFLTEQDMII